MRERDPRELGVFRMLGRLGYGGMGVAYLARGEDQWAVVKVVRSDLGDSSTFRARLARELEAMRRAEGPYTATLLDSDLDGDPAWFAMEFIPGTNLTRRISDAGPLSAAELTDFAAGLAQALDHVHGVGIVHRDLKPSNVMMSPTGPRLIDFGIAGIEEGTHLTSTGSVVGSTGWLAPEQVTGDPVTAATDVHAWALCVLFAATGTPPFGADSATASLYRVLEVAPAVPDSIPEPLRGLLAGALAKDPAYRPTLDQVVTALATGTHAGWTPPPVAPGPLAGAPAVATGQAGPTATGRPAWLVPAAVGGGVLAAVILVLVAALGGSGQAEPNAAGDAGPVASALPAASDTSGPGASGSSASGPSSSDSGQAAPEPTPSPTPIYAVKVQYAGDAIPDAEFPGTLNWTFDVCSPDRALLNQTTADGVRLYASEAGSWKRIAVQVQAIRGGRCDPDQVNLIIPYTEEPPAQPTSTWSACRKYRVVIPETSNYQRSNVDMCVRTRAA